MKKVLVIGGSSFIGLNFLDNYKDNYECITTYYKNKISIDRCKVLRLDITDCDQTRNIIQAIKPDVIVICSAITSVILENSNDEEAEAVNIGGVKNIAQACKEINAKLIFLSSEYVFSGNKNIVYKENDEVDPIQLYGRTKVEGEKIVSELPNHAIIRTSLVYGWPKQFQHGNFVTTIIDRMNEREEFTAYTDMYRTPTYIKDITKVISIIIDNQKSGIFHVSSPYFMNMYEFAQEICKVFHLDSATLAGKKSPDENIHKRPKKMGLCNRHTQEQLNIMFKTVSEGLNSMKEEMIKQEKKQRVALVTGGAGFIGSHLVEALAEKGLKVKVLDSLVKGRLSSIQYLIDQKKVEFIEGDIRNKDIVDETMKDVDFVFHTAGIHIQRSAASPDDCISTNIQGSYNIFKSALDHKVKRVIFSSSSSVYGEPKKLPMHENDQLNIAEPYGASKLFCEHLLQHLAKKGLKYNALRYFNVYGERQAAHAYYTTVVTNFIKRIMNNEPPTIDGKGAQSMDFTHVFDVVRANILAMESEAVNEVFNVGTGVSTSIAELAQIIIKALDKEIKPVFRDREVLVTRRQADISKAEQLLKFKAQVNVKEGLTKVALEIAAHPDKY